MTNRTRYFLTVSLLITALGIGVGLFAYYGFQGTISSSAGPAELRYLPADASLVAFADVQAVMNSELRQQIRRALPAQHDRPEQFERETGINVERDIDHVVAFLGPDASAVGDPSVPTALVLARGRFDAGRIESSLREHGAGVETYRGVSLWTVDGGSPGADHQLSLAFVEPGVVALGSPRLVRTALDRRDGGSDASLNVELLDLVRSTAGDMWAVGVFDEAARQQLPPGVREQVPSITRFAASGEINGGLRASLRVDAIDEQAASEWREVVAGFLALARLQAPDVPELQNLLDSVELGGTGTTVSLAVAVPPGLFEWLGRHAGPGGLGPGQPR